MISLIPGELNCTDLEHLLQPPGQASISSSGPFSFSFSSGVSPESKVNYLLGDQTSQRTWQVVRWSGPGGASYSPLRNAMCPVCLVFAWWTLYYMAPSEKKTNKKTSSATLQANGLAIFQPRTCQAKSWQLQDTVIFVSLGCPQIPR